MSIKKVNIITSTAALILGGAIYILYRENSYLTIFIENFITLSHIRNIFNPFESIFIKYYFIDFLWALSLTTALLALFNNKRYALPTCLMVFFVGSFWELLQFLNIISGTGDIVDVFMYLAAFLIAVIINNSKTKGEQI